MPVALDRFGLRVRFGGADGPFDARFDFPAPVRGIGELRRAMHALFDAAARGRRILRALTGYRPDSRSRTRSRTSA